jgi:hypothetical protein
MDDQSSDLRISGMVLKEGTQGPAPRKCAATLCITPEVRTYGKGVGLSVPPGQCGFNGKAASLSALPSDPFPVRRKARDRPFPRRRGRGLEYCELRDRGKGYRQNRRSLAVGECLAMLRVKEAL